MHPLIRNSLAPALAALLLAGTLGLRHVAATTRAGSMTEDVRYYLPPAEWLRFFSLGYNEAMADLIWVKTVIHFGEQMKRRRSGGDVGFVMNYLRTAVDLDPRFRSLYTVGSTLTMFQSGGRISRRSLDMAIELLERGIEVFPDDGELFFSLGFIHHYEMLSFVPEDPDDPETREHLRLGRYYIGRAALMKNAPPYAAALSAGLMEKWDVSEALVAHLKAMLLKETEPRVRAALIEKLRREAGRAAERDIQETERLQRAWREDFPFVPFDFYLILRTEAPVAELLNPLHVTDHVLEALGSADD